LYWDDKTYFSSPNSIGVIDPNTRDSFQLIHTLINEGKGISSFWASFNPIVYLFMAKTGIGFENAVFARAKVNVNPCNPGYKENEYFAPHADVPLKVGGITAIYYINDADGDTIFFETPEEDGYGKGQLEIPYNLKEIKRIRPKKGALVYFDNQILHTGSPPKHSPFRSVVNFNWIKK
jgi:hypothetical protein